MYATCTRPGDGGRRRATSCGLSTSRAKRPLGDEMVDENEAGGPRSNTTTRPREVTRMNRFDITQTNAAVERLIETTENPRHLYLLHAYNRHRYLEMAGRFEEIFTPEMTVETRQP